MNYIQIKKYTEFIDENEQQIQYFFSSEINVPVHLHMLKPLPWSFFRCKFFDVCICHMNRAYRITYRPHL